MRGRARLIEELLEVLTSAGYEDGVAVVMLGVLTDYLGGRQVYWPKSVDGGERADRYIALDKAAGMTTAELARKYRVSEQSIYNALHRHEHAMKKM